MSVSCQGMTDFICPPESLHSDQEGGVVESDVAGARRGDDQRCNVGGEGRTPTQMKAAGITKPKNVNEARASAQWAFLVPNREQAVTEEEDFLDTPCSIPAGRPGYGLAVHHCLRFFSHTPARIRYKQTMECIQRPVG
jgi:hypothetical protein